MDRQVSVGVVQLFTGLRTQGLRDGVFMESRMETSTSCGFPWLICSGPGADWLGNFVVELVNFLLTNSEYLCHAQSLTWESNQSKDFFAS